jgi:DNA-binding protein H-NS
MQPKKSSLTTLSNEALCNLRDEIAALLKSRAEDLRRELDRLSGGAVTHVGSAAVTHVGSANGNGNGSRAPRKKVIPKYQGPDGQTWAGRGVRPRWLTNAINEGKQLRDFLIVAPNEASIDS